MKDFRQMVDTYVLDHEKHKKYLAFVLALSMMVTFAVPLSLMQPAESMTANREFLATPLAGATGNETLHPVSCSDPNCTNSAHTYSEVDLLVGKNSELRGATIEETIRNANATYAIGIASQFCIFLDGDFTTTDADAEGRVAVSGNVDGRNWDTWYYEIGNGDWYTRVGLDVLLNDSGYAHVISNGSNFKHVNVSSGAAPNNHPNQSVQGQHYSDANGNRGEIFKRLQIGSNTTIEGYNASSDLDHFYRTDTFSVSEQFGTTSNKGLLLQRSEKLSQNTSDGKITFGKMIDCGAEVDVAYLTYTGIDPNAESIFFNFTDDEWAKFVECTHVKYVNIPLLDEPRTVVENDGTLSTWDTAYIVVNVPGTDVHIGNPEKHRGQKFTSIKPYGSTQEIWISRENTGDNDLSKNNDPGVSSLLYNFYEAEKLTIANNFQGTLLAPLAHVTDEFTIKYAHVTDENKYDSDRDANYRGHLSGALIAKSFNGATEFGYRPYTGPISILGSTSGYTIPVDKFITGTQDRLSGAAFKLTIYNEDNNVVTSWTSGNATEYVTIPTMIDFTGGVTYTDAPDEDPKNDLVQTRSYTVKEESAPEGYIGTEKTYTLTVKETINKDTLLPAEGGGTIPRDVAVEITITPNNSEQGEIEQRLSFNISDEYNEETQTMRKITIDGKEFWLEIENQKVSAVGVPTDETERESYESKGTTTSTSIEYLTDVYSRVITETVMTDVTVTDENGDAVLDADSNPVTERVVATEAVNTEDENGNSVTVYSTVTQVVTETVAVTAEDGSTVTVEGGSIATTDVAVTEKWSETNGKTTEHVLSEETVYVIYTDVQVTSTVISPSQLTNKTEVILDGDDTHYYFDPNSLMLMPLPTDNLKFNNDYGFIFKKIDEGGNPVTGATIVLEKKNGEEYAEVMPITASSLTIDQKELDANTLYRFRETVVPTGYEQADPVYVVKFSNGLIVHCESATEPTIPTVDNYDGWTPLTFNDDLSQRTITMEDQKIHGAKLMLYKSDADDADKNLTNTKFALYHESNESVPIKEGITIANGKDGFDFYEAFRNDPETAYIKNGYLVPGTYYLLETDAPDEIGYGDNLNRKYYFTVKDDYSISVGKPDAIPIKIHTQTANQQYFVCDANGTKMDWNNWGNGSPGFENVKSIRIKATPKFKIYTNIKNQFGLDGDGGKSFDSSEGTIQFDTPQNLAKLEIQCSDWNDKNLEEILLVEIQTSDGKKYVYNGSGSGNTGSGDSGSGNTGSGDTGADSESKPLTLHAYNKNEYVICNPNGEKLEGNDSIKFEGIKSVQIKSNIQPRIYVQTTSNAEHDTNLSFNSNVDAYLYDFGSAVDVKTFKIMTTNWDTGINITSVKITTSDGTVYAFGSTSTLTLSSLAETPKAEAAESAEESEKLEIREPKTKDDRIILDIPNKYNSDFNVTVTKNWNVKGNTSKIPSETDFALTLLTLERRIEGNDWKPYSCTPTFEKTSDVEWTYRYKNLPVEDENGNKYYYRIQEKDVPDGYELSPTYSENVENGVCKDDTTLSMSVTNTLKTTSHKVTKTWEMPEGTTVDLPDSIRVTLQQKADGETTWSDFKTVTITPDNGKWEYTFEDLPAEGMSYRAFEESLSGWDAEHDWSSDDSTAITNTYKTGGLRVEKNWEGDSENNRPEKITVKLYRKVVAGGNGNNAIVTPTEPTDATGGYDQTADYSRLLQYSLYFYDANMCGDQVGENSAVSWRNEANCHTSDNKDGVDYTGGFHDAGDHAMFGLPQGFTASTLGWSYYEFKDSFNSLGQTAHYKLIMDEFCDFFVKSTTIENGEVSKFLYQKGNGNTDHGYWGPPEDQSRGSDQMYVTSNSASDIAAEYAAALALHILNFPEDHPNVASGEDEYLKCAEALYRFSTRYSAIESNGPSGFYYEGNNGTYTDDQAWAAAWLYLVTNNNSYKQDCQTKLGQSSISSDRGHYWGNATLATAIVNAAYLGGSWDSVINFHGTWDANNNKISGKCGTTGYQVFNSWGSARHNALVQTTALITAKHIDGKSDVYSLLADGYRDWSKGQMKYILGDNSIASNGNSSTCFVTGFADNSSKYVHHRAASGYANGESRNDARYHSTNGHVLVGALVGGPNANGEYIDEMTGKDLIYQTNEVALDYNAGLVGAAAGLYSVYGTGTLADSLDDFPANSGIEPTYLTASTQSLTLNTQQSEKANAIKGIANVGSEKVAKGTESVTVTQNKQLDRDTNKSLQIGMGNYIPDGAVLKSVTVNFSGDGEVTNGSFAISTLNGWQNGWYQVDNNTAKWTDGGSMTWNTSDFSSNINCDGTFQFGVWWCEPPTVIVESVVFTYESDIPSTPQLTITPSQSTITEGDTLTLKASGNTNTVQWSCDSDAVTITPTTGNEVTITAPSVTEDTTVTITATDGDGNDAPAATAQITIKPKDLAFSIDKTKLRVNGGAKTVTLTATPSDNVTFTRSDGVPVTDHVITVNPTEVGELTITAARGSTSTTQKIEFVGDPFIEGENTMNVDDVKQLTLKNAIGTVTWALKEESDIVTISDTGEVTALKNGTVTVVATDSYDKKKVEFSITVDLFALDVDTSGMEEVDTLTLTKANDWTYTLQNLPITDEHGNAYVYYIEEVLDPATNTLVTPSAVYVPIDYSGNGIPLEENAGDKTIIVTNKLKSSVETTGQMPSAGGEGTDWYYMAGAAMMLAGIAGYFVLKRRQRSRADA